MAYTRWLARAMFLAVALGLCAAPLTAAAVLLQTSKSFKPSAINSGQTARLIISLQNNDLFDNATQVAFSDNFPAGMTTVPGTQSNSCGGSLTITANSISLAGGFAGSDGGFCNVSITVSATVAVTTTLTNTTSSFTCVSPKGCAGPPASADLVVAGNGVPPLITSAPPPAGTVGIFYVYLVTATGIPTPSLSAIGLPPGLAFFPGTNQIVGTPTQAGSFAVSITASNGVQPNDTQNYTITINPPLAISIPGGGASLPGGSIGQAYGPVTFTGSGGSPPYRWSVCNRPLPPGLGLSAGGTLSGTPTQPGTYVFDVCLSDSTGAQTSKSFTLVIVTVKTTLSVTITPNPAASGLPVVVTVNVTGASVAATGQVQVWVAGTGTKCPARFGAGTPTDPDAAMRTATLDATGSASLTYASLAIDDFLVCVQYLGDGLYPAAVAGPFDLSVIKGFLLPPPTVKLSVPAQAPASAKMAALVSVSGTAAMPVPQGSVRVRDGQNEIGSANLVDGNAVISVGMPPSGAMTLTADYSGDALYPPASSDSATVQAGEALAFASVPAAIPTLRESLLGILALFVAAFGMRYLRRR